MSIVTKRSVNFSEDEFSLHPIFYQSCSPVNVFVIYTVCLDEIKLILVFQNIFLVLINKKKWSPVLF